LHFFGKLIGSGVKRLIKAFAGEINFICWDNCLAIYSKGEAQMGKKLYVGNLPYTIDDQKLMQAFASYGQVASAKVVIDRESGRSKGFGFVEMSTDEEASSALSSMNGFQMDGRALNVSEAREAKGDVGRNGPRSGGFVGGRGGGAPRGGGSGSRFGGGDSGGYRPRNDEGHEE
jgi:RNA recognition motif-containing protein